MINNEFTFVYFSEGTTANLFNDFVFSGDFHVSPKKVERVNIVNDFDLLASHFGWNLNKMLI